jgi:hypothetical protein
LFAIARDVASNVNADLLALKRNLLEEAEAKYRAQAAALLFFEASFCELLKELIGKAAIEARALLNARIQQLESSPGTGLDAQVISIELARLKRLVGRRQAASAHSKTPRADKAKVSSRKKAEADRTA